MDRDVRAGLVLPGEDVLHPAATGRSHLLAPDVVVEILSDSSVRKDLTRLPPLYAAAGVPELWRVDARHERLRFEILTLEPGGYQRVKPGVGGWARSPRLGRRFRLTRHQTRPERWIYRLEHD